MPAQRSCSLRCDVSPNSPALPAVRTPRSSVKSDCRSVDEMPRSCWSFSENVSAAGRAPPASPDDDRRDDCLAEDTDSSDGWAEWAAKLAEYSQAKADLTKLANIATSSGDVEADEAFWVDLQRMRRKITPTAMRSTHDLSDLLPHD
mmetsp:Transcript_43540/g.111318  ORF Transcript_43540/g.111318 Transcript_43540/m.111318 type:complete len:147 (-) Transcript_43540:315-755(-)